MNLQLLQYILPELEEGFGMAQNHHHTHNVFDHNILSLKHCPNPAWQIRFAADDDIGKARTKKSCKARRLFIIMK